MTPVPANQVETAQFAAVQEPPPARARRRRLVGWVAVGLVVVLAVGGTAAYAYAGDVPHGTTVLGTDIGGLSRDEAEQRLRADLADRLAVGWPVRLGARELELLPADVGLEVDVAATLDEAAAGGPRLWGSRDVAPVKRVDAAKLDAVLRAALDPAEVTIGKPGIRYEGLTPRATYPEPGRNLDDPERNAELVRSAWLVAESVEIPLVERTAVTTAEEVDRLVAELAAPAVAAPVTVTTDGGSFTLPPAVIAKSLVFPADAAGKITAKVDAKKLRAAAGAELARVETQPKDARFTATGGKPKLVASTDGRTVDVRKLAADLLPVLPQSGSRTVPATLVAKPAETTEADLAKLGIKEKVSTFTTFFSGGLSSGRSQNIIRAARQTDGAVVKPGEVFSLNGHTGERGYAQGYVDAPIILDGKLVPGVGGGISQFTTTLFNAAYYAGLEDVEHRPHSYYFSRYPSVIESTIFYPTMDLKFRNDTPHGIVIDTSHTSDSVTVTMWSTKVYDSVKTRYEPRRDFVQPRTIHLEPGPSCIATEGIPGFSQVAWRIFRKDGKELKRERFSWRYDAEPRYICGPEPS